MKTELELNNGKRRKFHANVAKVLVSRGLGTEVSAMTYQTREMRADPPKQMQDDELDALRAEANKRGIQYHHRAGVAKLRELLEG